MECEVIEALPFFVDIVSLQVAGLPDNNPMFELVEVVPAPTLRFIVSPSITQITEAARPPVFIRAEAFSSRPDRVQLNEEIDGFLPVSGFGAGFDGFGFAVGLGFGCAVVLVPRAITLSTGLVTVFVDMSFPSRHNCSATPFFPALIVLVVPLLRVLSFLYVVLKGITTLFVSSVLLWVLMLVAVGGEGKGLTVGLVGVGCGDGIVI